LRKEFGRKPINPAKKIAQDLKSNLTISEG
jgi:hypothetical protein